MVTQGRPWRSPSWKETTLDQTKPLLRLTPTLLIGVPLIAVLLTALLWAWPNRGDLPERSSTLGHHDPGSDETEAAPLLGSPSQGAARNPAQQDGEAWADGELITALTRLGELGPPDPRLGARLAALLEWPSRAERTLQLVQGPRLTGGNQTLSLPERGAVLALGFAAATYGRPGADAPPAVRSVDRMAFVTGLIEALPRMRPAVANRLVSLMERLRLGERPVIGPAFLQVLLDCRSRNPGIRPMLDTLLEECTAELPQGELDALAQLFVHRMEDPTMVRVAFTELLKGEDGAVFLQLASQRMGDETIPAGVRGAIVEAVAQVAPVEAAVDAIVEYLEPSSADVMIQLASREGGTEALIEAYAQRLGPSGSAEERRCLLIGLERGGQGELLLDIAQTDPSQEVRGQALISLTLDPDAASAETLEALVVGRSRPSDPFLGLGVADATIALSNLALHSHRTGDLALADRAIEELKQIARSPQLPVAERRRALRKLGHHLPTGHHGALALELDLGAK